ncbi:hypothetical protein EV421DRAFT_1806758 [Armillaria borealis]|uniref:Uncharacterized protein n=1 Tax=Armillaria borealis TaxID=47425 RepID=A0AA39MQ28_9AGAR|nr:hypothetical protein EV421DRAFT_1806758 [Armillaria borealis]
MSLIPWILIMTIMPICFHFISALPSYARSMHPRGVQCRTLIPRWSLVLRLRYPIFLKKSTMMFSTCFPTSWIHLSISYHYT